MAPAYSTFSLTQGHKLKQWDHAIPADAVDLGVWMDAEADPEASELAPDGLVVDFPCWTPRRGGQVAAPQDAGYQGRLHFTRVSAFRILDGELGPYRLVPRDFEYPPCFFEVQLSRYDPALAIVREDSWYPVVRRERDMNRWFAQLDAWDPTEGKPPALPPGSHHFVVVGCDSYVEVLASSFEFERVPSK